MTDKSEAILAELRKPFPPEVVQWKPGATTKDRKRALALAYVDSREYFQRLNEAAGTDWQDAYEITAAGDRLIVVCRLTVAGSTRTGDGECDLGDENAMTSASAQAFKRACVKYGLGAYLYDIPRTWADYDASRKRFTDQALKNLEHLANGANPSRRSPEGAGTPAAASGSGDNGDGRAGGGVCAVVVSMGKYKGKTLGEIAQLEPSYLSWLAESWQWEPGRQAAAALLADLAQPESQAPPFA